MRVRLQNRRESQKMNSGVIFKLQQLGIKRDKNVIIFVFKRLTIIFI